MPMYEFVCDDCGAVTSELRSIADRHSSAMCRFCSGKAQRVISAPRLSILRKEIRAAHETNERSAHEPKVSNRHVCGTHCHHHKKTEQAPALKQQTRVKRPWMLGH